MYIYNASAIFSFIITKAVILFIFTIEIMFLPNST